jgi:hypothetical protein
MRVYLDPKVPDLAALGFADADEVLTRDSFARGRAEATGEPGRSRLILPLPGTPAGDGGPLAGRPGGAGTGWIVLDRWQRASWRGALGLRFSAPRSASPAERAWNLYCHLRAHGIGTPEPLAVGARGSGLVAPASFLVTRELTGYVPCDTWFGNARLPEVRRRGIEALGLAFARLRHARVFLPRLARAHVLLSLSELSAQACADQAPPQGLRLRRLPSVAIAEVAGGIICAELGPAELVTMLGGVLRPVPAGPARASALETARFLALALDGLARARSRAVVRRVCRSRP